MVSALQYQPEQWEAPVTPKIDLPSPVEAPVYHGPLQTWTPDKTTSQVLREPQDQVKREVRLDKKTVLERGGEKCGP